MIYFLVLLAHSKALDTLNHKRLISSDIQDHNGNKSNNFLISRGVLYPNDLPSKLRFCNVKMYSDNVQLCIICLLCDITNCNGKINYDLDNVFQWATIDGASIRENRNL